MMAIADLQKLSAKLKIATKDCHVYAMLQTRCTVLTLTICMSLVSTHNYKMKAR